MLTFIIVLINKLKFPLRGRVAEMYSRTVSLFSPVMLASQFGEESLGGQLTGSPDVFSKGSDIKHCQ